MSCRGKGIRKMRVIRAVKIDEGRPSAALSQSPVLWPTAADVTCLDLWVESQKDAPWRDHPRYCAHACGGKSQSGFTIEDMIRFHVCDRASVLVAQVVNDDEVRLLFRQVQGEVPGSPIFAMKLAPASRHLEVQLVCDMWVYSKRSGDLCPLPLPEVQQVPRDLPL